jgi:hypothetical protein
VFGAVGWTGMEVVWKCYGSVMEVL